jgi:ParB family transcriptional regulator, chromosome partitioning protein
VEFKKIPLDQIHVQPPMDIKKIRDVYRENIDFLADSIAVLGLIQPIAVYRDSEQEYVVIDGARRLHACHKVNEKFPEKKLAEIECVIHAKNEDESEKIIHTSMHLGITPLSNPDISRSIDRLWENYSDIKLFERKFGISKHIVRKYGARLLLPEFLKDAINNGVIHSDGKIATDIAIKCVHALQWTADNDVSDEKVLEFVKEYAKLTISRGRDIF